MTMTSRIAARVAFAEFVDCAQEQLPRLRRGDRIDAVGRISQVSAYDLSLESCEFAD